MAINKNIGFHFRKNSKEYVLYPYNQTDINNLGCPKKLCFKKGSEYMIPAFSGEPPTTSDSCVFQFVSGNRQIYYAANPSPTVTVQIKFDGDDDVHCNAINTNVSLNNAMTIQARPDTGDDWEPFGELGAGQYRGTFDPDNWIGGNDYFYCRILSKIIYEPRTVEFSYWTQNFTPGATTWVFHMTLLNRYGTKVPLYRGYLQADIDYSLVWPIPAWIDFDNTNVLTSGQSDNEKTLVGPTVYSGIRINLYYYNGFTGEEKLDEWQYPIFPVTKSEHSVDFTATTAGGDLVDSVRLATPEVYEGKTSNITFKIPISMA